ncbi:hypothetical protein POV27_06895 [Aureisphaera galaxeae]|uniref:hypothetical protein n=1 Tax=Aureisphaera galaxeae TaxID=1538023 RepID=UPI0023507096|nr:hypothetical protein [Aureisphaera galaxeae]MDC8003771.1 hypothetical protein [Aureisphaera galaxeae]
MTTEELQLSFYQEIGQLFYAVAAADKVVRKSEYDALRKIVKDEWMSLDYYKDSFGADAAFQIEVVFDWFDYEQMNANECFKSFREFYKDYKELFTPERKQLIIKTAHAIAGAFAGKNKSELILLTKLTLLFKEK